MRDPYDVLGISRQASFDDVKAAYRRACKAKHPDMGGSQQDFVELQAAYETILDNLKRGYERQRQDAPADPQRERREQRWERTYRDIDDELEELRRSTRAREEMLHAMRAQVWQEGNTVAWAKLTWKDLATFVSGLLRGGVKGLAVLLAALIGLGSILVEANAVSAIIMFGGGIGFVMSQALKSDKGGILSASLLLFGIMTIWLPPVREALVHYPVATISLLVCLALIFKFGQQGGIVGLLTGGLLTLYVIAVILAQTPLLSPVVQPPPTPVETTHPSAPTPQRSQPASPRPTPEAATPVSPPVPEVRDLIASKGAVLKFAAGVTYRLKIRAGFTTVLTALRGSFATFRGEDQSGDCTVAMTFAASVASTTYVSIDDTFRACGPDIVVQVSAER